LQPGKRQEPAKKQPKKGRLQNRLQGRKAFFLRKTLEMLWHLLRFLNLTGSEKALGKMRLMAQSPAFKRNG